MTIAVGILIGGVSRRMGQPKAIMPVGDTTLIERTVAVARVVSEDVVLLGRPPMDLPPGVGGLLVIEDRQPGMGPIGGLESLLRHRSGGVCILLACDMPNLTSRLLGRLCEVPTGFDAAAVRTTESGEQYWHPCCAAYAPSVLPAVERAIADGRHGMIRLLSRLRVQPVELAGDQARWVENWNEPGDVG